MALGTYSVTTPRWRPKGTKPPPEARINRSHPLGANLIWCSVFHPGVQPFNAADLQSFGTQLLPGTARYTEIHPGPYNWRGPAIMTGDEVNVAGTGIKWNVTPKASFFRTTPVIGYSFAAIWLPSVFTLSTTRMMDAPGGVQAVVAIYNNPSTIGIGYSGVTWRNAAGTTIDFVANQSTQQYLIPPPHYLALVNTLAPAGAGGGGNLWTNHASGVMKNEMILAFSDTNADASHTWASMATFQPTSSGTETGTTLLRGRIYGQWVWQEQVLTSDHVKMWYDDPWCMFHNTPAVEPASLMEMTLAAGVTARPFAAGAGGWVK